ncbi:Ankyrin repeat [Thalictrum thalictroides]|uniref:Ankyrin repeat n=1 Tax=Thalictrum thalictroides TaxID=46969 RepID=A0A7J6X4Q0_THATH|nr:Ankyrin repeat [Thalictrum thalictroides]
MQAPGLSPFSCVLPGQQSLSNPTTASYVHPQRTPRQPTHTPGPFSRTHQSENMAAFRGSHNSSLSALELLMDMERHPSLNPTNLLPPLQDCGQTINAWDAAGLKITGGLHEPSVRTVQKVPHNFLLLEFKVSRICESSTIAIFTVPCGDDDKGMVVVVSHASFKIFFDIALFTFLAVVVVQITLVRGETKSERRVVEVINKLMWLASVCTSVAFIASSYTMVGRHYKWAVILVTVVGGLIMEGVLGTMTYYVVKSKQSRSIK